MTAPDLLVSDREREAAADRLRSAAGEGRLTAEELDERVGRVYGARTHGELTAALTGLPPVPVRRRRRTIRGELAAIAAWWVPPNLICILVWAATGTDGSFWPKWVLLGTTIAVLRRTRRLFLPPAPPPALPSLPPLPPLPSLPGGPPERPRDADSAS